ncbi:TPA: amino acid ABC transporter permease [Photobacterium damselae]|uniref:amino acid ABC transporter permease n=1 Tax=Photobacterium damselae TaxID=38293 RepID=UPI00084AD877|nr:amino acid ABC transporter permease [Photobacterium damselae]KAB1175659.1 amino acid ABC transporter permease [Photobacterium damselae subsp. damselae]MBA5683491.1 amino acid ABC transporter permease [Photobacterium damselae subsp. damselae]MBF7098392.1 amino acid ABC transporter permease [Photobacterium damselae]NVO61939.1 amino acid ABC transporter permease [Photobacterium damselae subsp. damselae]OEC83863.1 polar amino acid ABC transporter permease [Photobacterium damselae subsp. damsela
MTHSNSSLQKSVSNKLNWWQICKPAFSALVQIGLVIAVLGWILSSGADAMNYRWQWHQIPQYLFVHEDGEWYRGELIDGLLITLKISAVSLIFTLGLGLITALLRLSDSIVGRALARGYIELIRNTPLLVQIYILYFVLGPILDLERFTTAVLALSLFQGAYTAEIFRAGLNAIPKGQFEAAASLGLSQWQMYRFVILPQVIKRILPPLTNETVSLVKNSSIVSIMAIFDLTTEGRNIVADTAMPFEVWFTVAAIYLCVTLLLSAVAAWMAHRLNTAIEK